MFLQVVIPVLCESFRLVVLLFLSTKLVFDNLATEELLFFECFDLLDLAVPSSRDFLRVPRELLLFNRLIRSSPFYFTVISTWVGGESC